MHDLVILSLRVLFMAILPLLGAVALAGMVAGAVQSATAIHDPAISYAARLVAVVVVIYLLFPAFSQALISLTETAFR